MPAYQIVVALVLAGAVLTLAVICFRAALVRDEPASRNARTQR
ncbi:hypothetical protein [Nocardia sp. NPDC049149]